MGSTHSKVTSWSSSGKTGHNKYLNCIYMKNTPFHSGLVVPKSSLMGMDPKTYKLQG